MLHEHHLTVERTARYFTIEPGEAGAREVWFVCHGYSQLAERFLRQFEAVDDGSRLVVAPEALSRYYVHEDPGADTGRGAGARASGPHALATYVGASWMTREDRLSEIADYVAYLDALGRHVFRRVERSAVVLRVLGFSQGAATATRWAAQGTTRVDQLILWGGFLPPELDCAATPGFGRLPVLLVWGEKDRYFDRARVAEDEARLQRAGVPCRVVTYGGGHHVSREVLGEIASEMNSTA